MGHPAVFEAAVVAIPDDRWDERPLASVVLKEGSQVSPEELRLLPEWQGRQVVGAGALVVERDGSAKISPPISGGCVTPA